MKISHSLYRIGVSAILLFALPASVLADLKGPGFLIHNKTDRPIIVRTIYSGSMMLIPHYYRHPERLIEGCDVKAERVTQEIKSTQDSNEKLTFTDLTVEPGRFRVIGRENIEVKSILLTGKKEGDSVPLVFSSYTGTETAPTAHWQEVNMVEAFLYQIYSTHILDENEHNIDVNLDGIEDLLKKEEEDSFFRFYHTGLLLNSRYEDFKEGLVNRGYSGATDSGYFYPSQEPAENNPAYEMSLKKYEDLAVLIQQSDGGEIIGKARVAKNLVKRAKLGVGSFFDGFFLLFFSLIFGFPRGC